MLFASSYKVAAKAVQGKRLVVGGRVGWILKAKGFSRVQNDAGVYRPVVEMKPGQIFCPRMRNAILILVACLDGDEPGGCVLIDEIELNGLIVKGPGRVSEALGLEDPKAFGRIREDGCDLVMDIEGVRLRTPPALKVRSCRPLGKAVLEKHMPRLVKMYRARKAAESDCTFEIVLRECVSNCREESELRSWLREQERRYSAT